MKTRARKALANYIAKHHHGRVFAVLAFLFFIHSAMQYSWREYKRLHRREH